jgi:hypothetical protein
MVLLPFLMLLVSLSAQAGVLPMFSQDGKTLNLLMAGVPSNPDAVGLWNAIKAPPEDFQGKWSKRVEQLALDGGKGFDIACVFSKMIMNTGTCTVILHDVPGMIEINASARTARFYLSGEAAAKFAALFELREENPVLFRSQDGHLSLTVARDRGVITDFVLDWR